MTLYENISKNLKEGITLTAFVRDQDGNTKMLVDKDYNSKSEYARDLRANSYIVKSVKDNRDLYIIDHSDYKGLDDVYERMMEYKKMWKNHQKEYPESNLWKDDYEKLKQLYDEAMKQEL